MTGALARVTVLGEQGRELEVLGCKAWKPSAPFAALVVKSGFAGKMFVLSQMVLLRSFDHTLQVPLPQWISR